MWHLVFKQGVLPFSRGTTRSKTITQWCSRFGSRWRQTSRRDGPISSLRLEVKGTVVEAGKIRDISVGGAHASQLADCVSNAVFAWSTAAKPGRYLFHIDMKTL